MSQPNAISIKLRLVICLILTLFLSQATAQDNTVNAEELIRQLQAQNANLRGRLDRSEASRDRLREQVTTMESAATTDSAAASTTSNADAQLARNQAAYERLKQQMANLQTNNADLEARIDREQAAKGRIQNQLAALQESAAQFETQAEDANASLASLIMQRKTSTRQILDLQKQLVAAGTAPVAAATESMGAASATADMAKLQVERDIAVQRIRELRGQMSTMEAASAKTQSERDLAVQRIGELRSDFSTQQEVSAAELARAIKLGERARSQRATALEKLKAMGSAAMDTSSETTASEEAAPANVEDSQVNAAASLELYRNFSNRLAAGETLSTEEQNQYNSALATLSANQKIVAEQIGGTTYTVVEGDNLSSIAQQTYGDANSYQKILEANNYLIDDADLIFPGFELVLPQ